MEQLDVVKRENKNLADEIKICLISLATVAAPSTSWTNRGGGLRSRKKSFRELLRRPREPLSRRRTRFSEPLWSLARSARRLIAGLPRRRRSSRIAARTTLGPWTPCRQALSQSSVPRPRL